MPKFTIELDTETHQILKEQARKEKRSLTNYMEVILDKVAGTSKTTTEIPFISNTFQPTQSTQVIKENNSIKAPEEPNSISLDPRENMKEKIRIYLDTFNIPAEDKAYNTFTACKDFIEEHAVHKTLTPSELNITMFDEVQEERGKKHE